jgi:CelD/BcsL family acetyltransferase involved in cellulose biosynthesis
MDKHAITWPSTPLLSMVKKTSTNPPIAHIDELRSIEAEWRALYDDSTLKSVFATYEFVSHWYSCFARPDAVRVYRIVHGGTTIGFLPLVLNDAYGCRVLSSLTNFHVMHSTPVIRHGFESAFADATLDALLEDRKSWDVLQHYYSYSFLPGQRLFSPAALKRAGLSSREIVWPDYTIGFSTSFEEYFSRILSTNTKKGFKRRRNRLLDLGTNRVTVHRGQDAMALWSDFLTIEDGGWKGTRGSSIRRLDDTYRRYYKGFLDLISERGELTLYFLELDGVRIAGEMGYTEGDVFHWFKSGYDERYSDYAPSTVLMVGVIEDLMRNRPDLKRLHLFPGNFGYKHRYVNEQSLCTDTIIYNRTARGKIAELLARARTMLRDLPAVQRLIARRRADQDQE